MSKKIKLEDNKFTTSKKILWLSTILFIILVALAIWFSYLGIDTSVFAYILPISGGIAGATIAFYMNKSKMENIFKFKISFLEYKIDLIDKHPDKANIIDKEVSDIDSALDESVDTTLQEAVNEEINIQDF